VNDVFSKNNIRTLLVALTTMTALPAVMLSACAEEAPLDGSAEGPGPEANTPGGSGEEEGEGICLLNNCNSDLECGACEDDRNTCLVDENRCVACDPVSGTGCPEGKECSSFGLCVDEGQTCPTDGEGTPTVSCAQNSDCAACSPMHQVCDTATGQCQACTATNTSHCLASDICVDGECAPKCPQSCDADNDCSDCGGPGGALNACNAHKCAECSDTWPCAAGMECENGTCVPQCGLPGPTAGGCYANEDCAFCGDGNSPDGWECKKPINANDPSDHGTCGPKATGCSDLGDGSLVLPSPWDQGTNTCSDDADCAGQGITYSVSELIKDAIGGDEIDLGFTEVKIQDANVTYGMNKCADVEISNSISCGICVPCEQDADCKPIQIDPLIGDLFSGQPFAQLAGSLLIDLLYGDIEDHDLNFFCQPVAAGYGVCAPCSNPFQACGSGGSSNVGSGSCTHNVCDTGAALDGACDSCAASVCAEDPYCCTTEWDSICVGEVDQFCGAGTCNGGGGSNNCHDECTVGAKMSAACGTCVADVCAYDSFCCDTEWDALCVDHADALCGGC